MIGLERPPCPNPEALRTDYRHPENKAALRRACTDKCMYCESTVTEVYFGDVEHIRPKSLFPDLEFVWENLGFVCAKCNSAKSNKWEDDTPFVDPFTDTPERHLTPVGNFIFHVDGDERGEYTWREIDLNRAELLAARQSRIKAILVLVDKLARTQSDSLRTAVRVELEFEISRERPFSATAVAAYEKLAGSLR